MVWEFVTDTPEQTQNIAEKLAALLQAGDLIILSGELGAGKTTFTQGLGRSLGVRPGIISPTFVLVRIHPNLPEGHNPGGPDLVHVDAYRLATPGEIDDIDLENTMDSSVTVVEWGEDRVEHLAASRLEIELLRAVGNGIPEAAGPTETGQVAGSGEPGEAPDFADSFDADEDDGEPRTLRLRAVGPRWATTDFSKLGPPKQITELTINPCES
ncbi:tRNA (adenosine(37)-N6)-threonylcarbamoyltransferase complex ATPase subunit type 1 TsaE [Arthrobacter sp.]|uniref:tRNA (adenosine(37)-N6)-threonylcarbamoyltransferase complex ATPase subunit type 1 TsaE n=1 Tax=Arthrobacter sp. TaxID=1667 RepID=UPI0026E07224|nr:tRNA (adenosine(37)-N6)-threonylcarbamoyltransferase complex ATPase subunit type 1 TsaE [Arthrobacter sp.]MDO5752342.1 tRNA (adenosine(37)-N6)-threonylcarbamoyltransferase complex ATPase subunit type 1 TsaE [Arthrobacter sp.]